MSLSSLTLQFRSSVTLGRGGLGDDCGGARVGCVGLGLGFEEEHDVGCDLGFELCFLLLFHFHFFLLAFHFLFNFTADGLNLVQIFFLI